MTQPGRPVLFWIGFAAVLASGAALIVALRSFLDTLTPLWVSMGLSCVGIVVGVLAVTLPGRRDR